MAHGHLARSDDEYPTLLVTPKGHAVLRGETTAAPLTSAVAPPSASATTRRPSSGVPDEAVFEALRALRREVAEERGVPPYLIFSDASLRDMARARPMTLAEFREVKGVGDWKLMTFGERFVAAVRQACLDGSAARRE